MYGGNIILKKKVCLVSCFQARQYFSQCLHVCLLELGEINESCRRKEAKLHDTKAIKDSILAKKKIALIFVEIKFWWEDTKRKIYS